VFWRRKNGLVFLTRNKERDKEVNRHYEKEGWRVI
jgi:G:T-mismatch repair DNA endonuclease (very short patch repair protein)